MYSVYTLQVVVNYEGTDIILGVSKPQSQYHFYPSAFFKKHKLVLCIK